MNSDEKLKLIKDTVKVYHDFPRPGIVFRDIFPVFQNVLALKAMRDLLVEHVLFLQVDLIVGLDSRGFLLGPMICTELEKPFLPIRKKGKLPGKVASQSYILEYSTDTFELQVESVKKGSRVLIIDDLLATGGSMGAALKLLESIGTVVVECLVIMELTQLKAREKLNAPVHSLLQYD